MKVVVYAICRNEEQFVDRWMDSMSEADQVKDGSTVLPFCADFHFTKNRRFP